MALPVLDAVTQQDSSGYANSVTFSHTCTGSNLGLLVFVACRTGSADLAGATYNGVSMTKEVDVESNNVCGVQAFSLIAPATGANDVVLDFGSNFVLSSAVAISYTGVDQTDMIEATNSVTAFNTSVSGTVTTVTNDALAIDCINLQNAHTLTVGSGQTERNNTDHSDANLGRIAVSEEGKAISGGVSMDWTISSGDNYAQALLAIKPAVAGSSPTFKPKSFIF